jgi:protein TonB
MIKKTILFFLLLSLNFVFAQEKVIKKNDSSICKLFPYYEEENVYKTVDIKAQFPGGIKAFKNEIISRFDKGISSDENNQVLHAQISFVIDTDGRIFKIYVESKNSNYNSELTRAIKSIKTKWIPAKINGQPVRYRFRIPLNLDFN